MEKESRWLKHKRKMKDDGIIRKCYFATEKQHETIKRYLEQDGKLAIKDNKD